MSDTPPLPPHVGTLQQSQQPSSSAMKNLVGIFIVKFDHTRGNMVEWQHPPGIDMNGVEFQAMASGSHRIASDVVYFSRPPYVGASVFQNVPTNIGRGAILRAVGVLMAGDDPIESLYSAAEHVVFLKQHASRLCEDVVDISLHSALTRYFEDFQHKTNGLNGQAIKTRLSFHQTVVKDGQPLLSLLSQSMRDVSAADQLALPTKVEYAMERALDTLWALGPLALVVWKACILKKRILIITQPPMEQACYLVLALCVLGSVPDVFHADAMPHKLYPRFCVNVNDVDTLADSAAYVACTSDAIFEIKTDLYDVLVVLPGPDSEAPVHLRTSTGCTISPQPSGSDWAKFGILRDLVGDAWHLSTPTETIHGSMTRRPWWQHMSSWSAISSRLLWHTLSWWDGGLCGSDGCIRSWQQMFGGSTRQGWHPLTDHDLSMDPVSNRQDRGYRERHAHMSDMMGDEDDGAAPLISDSPNQRDPQDNMSLTFIEDSRDFALLWTRFFHLLTSHTLSQLEAVLAENQDSNEAVITIHYHDMILLGLDPLHDFSFVQELAELYFEKTIVLETCSLCSWCTSCWTREAEHRLRL